MVASNPIVHSRPRARPGRRPDADKHAAMLLHARHLFVQQGFNGASMDVLAELAAVSKPTIYHHFGSKASLFDATFDSLLQQLPSPAELVGPPGDLPGRLHAIGLDLHRLATSPLMVDIQRMLILARDRSRPDPRPFWQKSIAPYQHAFSALLRAHATAGRLDIDDVDCATSQFFSLVASEPFIRLLMGETADTGNRDKADAHVEAAVRTFLCRYGTSLR